MQLWRICKQQYAMAAFSGEGARLFSGRWNPAGTRMVYCSSSLALAALEFFVHLDPTVAPDDLVSIQAEFPDHLISIEQIEKVKPESLPQNWRETENVTLQKLGSEWIASNRSLALIVPSAVIDGEWNILLNPYHPYFPQVQISEPRPFHFDHRMFSRQR